MRLRYLHLRDAPPLQRLAIPFWQESVLGRACAIRFVVGVNGSGKSRLLQALAQLFLALEHDAPLPFFVTLAYDLGSGPRSRTIFLQYQPNQTGDAPDEPLLLEFEKLDETRDWDWEQLPQQVTPTRQYEGATGTIATFLPQALIVYTSGAIKPWQALFMPPHPAVDIPAIGEVEERPVDWDIQREQLYLRKEGLADAADALTPADLTTLTTDRSSSQLGYLIGEAQLRLAVCAVTLHQAYRDFQQMSTQIAERELFAQWDTVSERTHSQSGLRNLLNEVGWRYPVTFGLRLDFAPERWHPADLLRIRKLYELASAVIGEPEPSNSRLLLFNLRKPTINKPSQLTIEALLDLFHLSHHEGYSPFDMFKQLNQWQQKGIISDVVLALRKRGVADLMLYDWLSDGEQLFTGRMALFHLLQGQSDVLVLLDEPETHFNDVWKRRIVDIIDDSLRNEANEIVITTHSSIALTDVFHIEVTLLHFDESNGRTVQLRTPIRTFGASPTVIMREIFGAPESVGQRAAEFLDLILMLAAHPEDIQAVWQADDGSAEMSDHVALQHLATFVQELPHDYGEGEDLRAYLLQVLRSVRAYTQRVTGRETITVIDALKILEDLTGEGFYQFEFRRRLRALRKRG